MSAHKGLTKEELAEMRLAFAMFDLNNDGTISKVEVGNVMRQCGQNPTEKEIQEIMQKAAKNKNDTIDFDGFCSVIRDKLQTPVQREKGLMEAFKMFDRNGNGKIDIEELKHTLKTVGERMTDDEVREMMAVADKDGDGKVSYKEFVQVFK